MIKPQSDTSYSFLNIPNLSVSYLENKVKTILWQKRMLQPFGKNILKLFFTEREPCTPGILKLKKCHGNF